MPTLLGGKAAEPAKPPGRCSAQRDKLVIGPGPDAGGSNQGKAGCVHTREKFGMDAALSLPAGAATEGVCAMAGIAAAATATNRRKSRCMHIGYLPLMSAGSVPAAASRPGMLQRPCLPPIHTMSGQVHALALE